LNHCLFRKYVKRMGREYVVYVAYICQLSEHVFQSP
jgi:hypothetical protein